MYLTPNDRAIYLYGGIMGAFLSSEKALEFDLSNHPWQQLQSAMNWLCANNPLFVRFMGVTAQIQISDWDVNGKSLKRKAYLILMVDSSEIREDNAQEQTADVREYPLPQAFLADETVEMPVFEGQPEVVVNPFTFHEEIRKEDHRYHRLPIGVLSTIDARVLKVGDVIEEEIKSVVGVIAHGDPKVEGLLFPLLYPNGRGYWQYQRRNERLPSEPTYVCFV
jgi:hypothetical protein